MKNLAIILTVVLLLPIAGNTSAQMIDGEWSITAGQMKGQELPESVLSSMSLMVTRNQFDAKSGGSNSKGKVVRMSRSRPPQLIFQIDSGDDSGREIKAIYERKGEMLKVAFSQGDEFPADFSSTMDNGVLVLTYNNNAPAITKGSRADRARNLPTLPEPEITSSGGGGG